ncbi:MAG: peptidylprolyl isomerase [Pirellulales bacterium]
MKRSPLASIRRRTALVAGSLALACLLAPPAAVCRAADKPAPDKPAPGKPAADTPATGTKADQTPASAPPAPGAAPSPAAASAASAPANSPIAATVNGEPIYVVEFNAFWNKLKQAKTMPSTDTAKARADVLDQIVKRRLVVQLLKREGGYVSDEEINKALEPFQAQAEKTNTTIEEMAVKQGASIDAWRSEVIWQFGWPKYLERTLTDHLQAYFEAHRKDFDGTLVRASHILLRSENAAESRKQLAERAAQLRAGIEGGKITFEAAAERYSAGPSRAQGGDLGYFPRYGVMVEPFAKAAFALDKGQISPPVSTPFGVHLIRATDAKPGSRQWTEVMDQMRMPASLDLFEKIADKEAANAKIEFTGLVPYRDRTTKEVVAPPGSEK